MPPEKVIGLLLDIIEMKSANFAPTYAGIDVLKIEGEALIIFFLEMGVELLVAGEKI